MENFSKTTGSATGQVVVSAVPMVVGAAIAEPALLAAMAGAGILAVGIVLTVGVIWVAQTMR
ncbi:MAG: hypothetical protein ABSC06_23810 [Rhodopila sp.]|jgi:hypothetical protein